MSEREALQRCEEAIREFLISVKTDQDNYVGGIERLKLEAALAAAKRPLLVGQPQGNQTGGTGINFSK